MSTQDVTITIRDVPAGGRRDRIVRAADLAKQAIFFSGSPPLPDDMLLRAAAALDNLTSMSGVGLLSEVAVVMIGTAFAEGLDAERNEQTKAALASTLCDPGAELAAMVENNRRLLEGSGETEQGPRMQVPLLVLDDLGSGDGLRMPGPGGTPEA